MSTQNPSETPTSDDRPAKANTSTGSTPSGHYVAGDSALASKPAEADFPETKVKVTQPTAFTDEQIEEEVVKAIKTVYDPEIPVNVFDLGLIYGIQINPDRTVLVTMTLTTPNCPAAGFLPGQVEARVRHLPMVEDARVEITFDPPFSPDMMSDEAKLELGFL
ncbi:MAG: iron-sulfur cluster assembly protein [Bacteroidetes bacterium]|nr:iron-sulfur cluster assembly protein [Bacteroidota bacterium]